MPVFGCPRNALLAACLSNAIFSLTIPLSGNNDQNKSLDSVLVNMSSLFIYLRADRAVTMVIVYWPNYVNKHVPPQIVSPVSFFENFTFELNWLITSAEALFIAWTPSRVSHYNFVTSHLRFQLTRREQQHKKIPIPTLSSLSIEIPDGKRFSIDVKGTVAVNEVSTVKPHEEGAFRSCRIDFTLFKLLLFNKAVTCL